MDEKTTKKSKNGNKVILSRDHCVVFIGVYANFLHGLKE